MNIILRKFTPNDWEAVKQIYLEGMATDNATFMSDVPSWGKWDDAHLPFARIVAETTEGLVVAWAALSSVSSRCVYAGVAEVSVYVATAHQGRNIGYRLLMELVTESEENGIWTLQSGIFPENRASIRIHEKAGFRFVGYREKIGKMNGKWRNTVLLERRSHKI